MSTAIKEPRLWDYVTRAGGSSIVLSVPGCYPPKPLNGVMVGCFLTPSLDSKYTYPAALKDEISEVVGEYLFDTKDFRTDDKEYLLRQVYEMTDRRFALAQHLLETKPWSLFAMVEMGPTACTTGSGSTWIPSTESTSRETRTSARSSITTATSTA